MEELSFGDVEGTSGEAVPLRKGPLACPTQPDSICVRGMKR